MVLSGRNRVPASFTINECQRQAELELATGATRQPSVAPLAIMMPSLGYKYQAFSYINRFRPSFFYIYNEFNYLLITFGL